MPEQASPDRRLFELARSLSEAKRDEAEAKKKRISVEEEIAKATGFSKPSGSQSYAVSGEFGAAKLTLKQPVTMAVVQDEIAEVKKKIGAAAFKKAFRTKIDVNAKGIAELENSNRDLWLIAMEAITKTPGKVSVELKSLEVINVD
jgi:hypothetical protein